MERKEVDLTPLLSKPKRSTNRVISNVVDDLLIHHINETSKKFDALLLELRALRDKVQDLSEFKVQMVATARFTSLLYGALTGIVTLIAAGVIEYLVLIKVGGI